ncbi:MAG: hypothetical protein GEV06_19195 [Luteitalea sp.]|nr:hypothetical protein [Luteitalea sp.]
MSEQSQVFADIRQDIRRLDQRLDRLHDSLHDRMSRQFVWLVGLQFTTLVTIISVILARG